VITFLILLFGFNGPVLDLDEVHGVRITATLTAHNKTYIFYAKTAYDSSIFVMNWESMNPEAPTLTEVPKDGRVKMVFNGGLLEMKDGIGLACYFCERIFHLNIHGDFIETIPFNQIIPEMKRVTLVTAWKDGYLFTWRKDGQTFVSEVPIDMRTHEIVFTYKDGYNFAPNRQGIIALSSTAASVTFFSEKFEKIDSFELGKDERKAGAKPPISLVDPVSVGGVQYLVSTEKIKKDRIKRSVFTVGNRLRQSHLRPLGKSPDNKWYLVRNFDLDGELQVLPAEEVEKTLSSSKPFYP